MDWTKTTPAAGMLVAFEGGWHVAGPESSPTVLNVGTRLLAHAYAIEEGATPLAPAPTPGGLFEALKGGSLKYKHWSSGLRIELEAGSVLIEYGPSSRRTFSYFPSAGDINNGNRAAVRRDLDRIDALAAYAAQPGWGGGE